MVLMSRFRRIVTHSGPFHADDVLAVAVLKGLAPDASIIRTRDQGLLCEATAEPSTIVVDVGQAFDPALGNFDHHQKSFTKVRENGVPFASIGLVWERYADDWLREVMGLEAASDRAAVRTLMDLDLVQSVDALDCGVVSGELRVRDGVALRVPSVADWVGSYNPTWESDPSFDACFVEAMEMGGALLRRYAHRALSEVRFGEVVRARDDGSPVLVLDAAGPWRRYVAPHHRVVIFPATGEDGWLAQAVGDPESTVFPPPLRIEYPLAWRGRSEEELRALTGVADATFCHRAGFIAGALSRDGARALAARLLVFEG